MQNSTSSLPERPIRKVQRRWKYALIALALSVAGLIAIRSWRRGESPLLPADAELAASLPRMNAVSSFVSSQECRECHRHEYETWHASFHRQMTQVARADTVLGPFDGVDIEDLGSIHRLSRRGDELWVESIPQPDHQAQPGASSPTTEGVSSAARGARRVVMTTGAHNMQVCWASSGQGNLLDELPIVYIRDPRPGKSRWAPLQASYLSPVPANVQSRTHWNTSCILCHATGGKPGLEETGATHTAVAELGISCESCHGPAAKHVRLKRQLAAGLSQDAVNAEPDTLVNPSRLPPERAAQVCGHCHSAAVFATDQLMSDFFHSGSAYRPGDDLLQTRIAVLPSRLTPEQNEAHQRSNPFFNGSYWPDGMIRVTGREYNGLVESACYQQGGLTCLSCHSMHQSDPDDQLAKVGQGNDACYQCHASYRDKLTAHTHHRADSAGSECYNCHMPHTTYGLFKAIRSHQITSPSVATTLATGRATACNYCHLDQTLSWSAEKLTQWYGHPIAELNEEQRTLSAAGLGLLKGDLVQRALFTWHAGWQPALEVSGKDWLPVVLAPLLNDPSAVIRLMTSRSLDAADERYAKDYDFMAAHSQRKMAPSKVRELWQALPVQRRQMLSDRVFVKHDGDIDEKTIRDLLRRRDDRGLLLQE